MIGLAPAKLAALVLVTTQGEWRSARAELAELRAELPRDPHVEIVSIAMHAPGGIRFDGRGAVAVAPGRALRMLLLGPGGRTALDVWATDTQFRLSVPDLDVVEQGGASAPRHLPVELFREWFLSPLEGRLLAAGTMDRERVFLIRHHSRPLEFHVGARESDGRRHFTLEKHDGLASERVEWRSVRILPSVGDVVHFRRPAMGLELAVEIESVSTEPPDPAAFEAPEGSS